MGIRRTSVVWTTLVTTLVTGLAAVLGGLVVAASPAGAIADRDCGDFGSQKAAQIFFLKQGGPRSDPHDLDAEGDGIACESNPAPYYRKRSLPGGGGSQPSPQPTQVRSSVNFSLGRSAAIAGESVRLSARVQPRGVRTVVFQRQVGRSWRVVKRDRSNRRGVATHAIRATRSTTTYRAVVAARTAGNKRLSAATSRARTLRVQSQGVRLTLTDSSVTWGEDVSGIITASPARRGREVSLQERRGGRWYVVDRGRQDRRGRVVLPVATDGSGDFAYRAVVHRAAGAAPMASRTKTLQVVDPRIGQSG